MKKLVYILLFVSVGILAQTQTENYVMSTTYKVKTTNGTTKVAGGTITNEEKQVSISYFDGLGRAKQSVTLGVGGNKEDVVTHFEYDAFGRQTKEYLPYVNGTYSLNLRAGNIPTDIRTFYWSKNPEDFLNVGSVNAFSEKTLEKSPLSRVLEQGAPGEAWKIGTTFAAKGYSNNSHTIKFEYDTNISNEVKIYSVTTSFANNTYTPTLQGGTASYVAGELTKTITKDENWLSGQTYPKDHTTEEFKNKQGQVILKRTYNSNQAHDTYYVYDDFGNLTYVLPPKAEATIDKPTPTELNELCYQYIYDYRNRLVEKKIPGKGWEYIVYDKLDRPVLTQDALLRIPYKWMFTKYDMLGRVAYTGIYSMYGSRVTMQNNLNNTASQFVTSRFGFSPEIGWISGSGTVLFYNNTSFSTPESNTQLLTINYYDNYSDLPSGFTAPTSVYSQAVTTNTKGLPTVSKVRVLETTNWITTATYYDQKARPIYVYSKNDFLGTTDIVESKLDDFTGKVLETKTTHIKGSNNPIITIDKFEYDHADRLKKQRQNINSASLDEVIVENTYDNLGQLTSKGVGGKTNQTRLQNVDYNYNIRGWLKNINDTENLGADLFSFKMNYNSPSTGTALFNGNISETLWKTSNVDISLKKYVYSYDALNRITNGLFSNSSGNLNNKLNLKLVEYDKNGNITKLHRNGIMSNGGFTEYLDHMDYTYQGNQLKDINELGHTYEGFANKLHTGSLDYTYDVNGNMITDANKSITSILYNHLNLPRQITINGQNIIYTYDASGVKLRKVVQGITTDYAGNYIYENNMLQFFNHAEGYVKNDNGVFNYVYQYKDHLGNVRVSYTDAAKTYQKIIDSNFETSFDGWQQNGTVNYTLENGRLKANVQQDWEGIRYDYTGAIPGQPYTVKIKFDKGNTQANVRFYVSYDHTNGTHAGYHMFSNSLQTGEYTFSYTPLSNTGNIRIHLDKDNTNTSTETQFYVDYITFTKGKLEIIEESNYYPFGLKHKGYNNVTNTYGNGVAQKYKYNGKEWQDELGLGWFDYGWRNYDPAIGRWINIDPLFNDLDTAIDFDQEDENDDEDDMLEAFSRKMEVGGGVYNTNNLNPYAYGYNDPVQFDDPDGRCPWCVGAIIGAALDYGLQVAGNYASGKTGADAWTDVDMKSIATSAVLGAASGGLSTLSKTAKVTKVVSATNNSNKTATTIKKIEKVEKTSSKYVDVTKASRGKSSTTNKKTDVTKKNFEKNLKKSGYDKTTSKDGKVNTFSKDGKSYTTRKKSKSGEATADFRKEAASKKIDVKIRLGE